MLLRQSRSTTVQPFPHQDFVCIQSTVYPVSEAIKENCHFRYQHHAGYVRVVSLLG